MVQIGHLKEEAQDFLLGKRFYGAVGMGNLFAPLSDAPRNDPAVTAHHVLFTQPYCGRDGTRPYFMMLHEQWTARLSAMLWRRYNGPIHLITDHEGARYIRQIGLDNVYDSVQDDLQDPYWLNQTKFWASGKLLAMQRMRAPCLIIDMDMLIWQPLVLRGKALVATHEEPLSDAFYPDTDYFIMSPKYSFPQDWDYTVEPLNTSVFYMGSEALRREYLEQSLRFMRYERDTPDNGSNCMIFAEQRILAMCAKKMGICAQTLLKYNALPKEQDILTHTWSGKRLLSRMPDVEAAFIELCREKCLELEKEIIAVEKMR